MSRTIKESTELLETSLQEIKSKLDEKVGGGVPSPLKVSQIAGYLDQIQTGGGGDYPLKGKYLSSNVEQDIYVYSVIDGPRGEQSFKVNVDIDKSAQVEYRLCIIKNDIDIKTCSETISHDNAQPVIDLGKEPIHKEIDFTIEGTGYAPMFLLVLYDGSSLLRTFGIEYGFDLISIPVIVT